MKKLIFTLFIFNNLYAQVPNHVWTKKLNGGSSAEGLCITTDKLGNVYTAGTFGSTSDLDPGVGVTNLTSNGGLDVFIIKTSSDGNFIWAKNFGGSGDDVPNEIVTDNLGNIYCTGIFESTADFDPSPTVFNLISNGGNDVFAVKISTDGLLNWAKSFGGTTNDAGNAIALDSYDGSVFLVGGFAGTVDLNPDAGVVSATSNGSTDIFMLKLSSTGTYVTSKNIGGVSGDRGNDIYVDSLTGNQFITGTFGGTMDFDPGVGTVNINGSNDVFVLKLSETNDFIFAKTMGGVAVDEGRHIAIDANGFIYVHGSFISTCNFNTDGGTNLITSNGGDDVFVVQLSASGSVNWVKTFGSAGTEDFMDMSVTSSGGIYLTGEMAENMDADPSPIVNYPLNQIGGAEDAYIIALTNTGTFNWAVNYGATEASSYGRGFGIFADENDNVYITGSLSFGTFDLNPSAIIESYTTVSGSDIWYQKLGPNFAGIETLEKSQYAIFPNPSNGVFTLKGKDLENSNITIFDSKGVPVFVSKEVQNETIINTDFLASGIYSVIITNIAKSEQLKLVIR